MVLLLLRKHMTIINSLHLNSLNQSAGLILVMVELDPSELDSQRRFLSGESSNLFSVRLLQAGSRFWTLQSLGAYYSSLAQRGRLPIHQVGPSETDVGVVTLRNVGLSEERRHVCLLSCQR